MSDRPVIGILTALERARWSVWDTTALLLPRLYVAAVQRAGGLVLMIPPDESLLSDPDELLDLLDGLILAGGADVDPEFYDEAAHAETKHTVPERDRFEIAMTRAALDRDLPLLGICRGMQVMNVARGGTLLQHLPESHGHSEHRRNPGSFEGAENDMRLHAGSLAARAAGEEEHSARCHHHQAVDQLGDGFIVTGRSALDDLPEAIELPDRRFALGVQWHPEADETSRLIGALVSEASAAMSSSSRSAI
jgi:putative glutamine amidotransferase